MLWFFLTLLRTREQAAQSLEADTAREGEDL